ncbi:hypothetical protein [Eilatimonas milleporae]|uniref:Uncharacterized protein n=1 Tax=Eilatimonas milleporae TaxID=911205 RepID=A0A3M0C8K8_9PROT|nr:hypothetical protein [Eilatimonas milleporae]RMB04690.1 hypothetical protein BXY39_2962 [Eilatimonas milleporae]
MLNVGLKGVVVLAALVLAAGVGPAGGVLAAEDTAPQEQDTGSQDTGQQDTPQQTPPPENPSRETPSPDGTLLRQPSQQSDPSSGPGRPPARDPFGRRPIDSLTKGQALAAARSDDEVMQALLSLSTHNWIGLRRTQQRFYAYVRDAAALKAYLAICPKHRVEVNTLPIDRLARQYLEVILASQFEGEALERYDALPRGMQAAFTAELGRRVFAFEQGFATAREMAAIEAGTTTLKDYCDTQARDRFDSFVALQATAVRALPQDARQGE